MLPFLNNKKFNDFSYILELQQSDFKGINRLIRVPGISVEKYDKIGTLYCVKYCFHNAKGPLILRFTSKDKSFKALYSFDICDNTMQPNIGYEFKDNLPPDKFHWFLQNFVTNARLKNLTSISSYLIRREASEETAVTILNSILAISIAIITLLSIIDYYVVKVKKWKEERRAEIELENKINESLFKNQTGKESVFDVYSTTIRYINYISSRKANALIICGPPGMSKTHIIRRTFYFQKLKPFEDYVMVKGSSLGLAETYSLFYRYRDKIIVLDDFDTPLQNPDMVSMLKAITDSYSIRILSLPREKRMEGGGGSVEESQAPDKFEFRGQVIIVTNVNKNQIDKALLSRAPTIEVNFDTEKVLTILKDMMKYINPDIPIEIKKEVYDYILKLKEQDSTIHVDFRGFKSAIEARYCIPEGWEEMTKIIVDYKGR